MKELAKIQKCIALRNGVFIWLDEDKAEKIQAILGTLQNHLFMNVLGRSLNTADMIGVLEPGDIEDLTRRKNGEWQCKYGDWHQKFTKCECAHRIAAENEGYCTTCYVNPCVCSKPENGIV
jgi:hypothetical protein